VRFDFRVGREGVAYVTDSSLSGIGGIIVIDLATGVASKRLVGHVSTSADAAFVPIVEGQQMRLRSADRFVGAVHRGRRWHRPVARWWHPVLHALVQPSSVQRVDRCCCAKLSEAELAAAVVDLGDKGASDGMEMDANGRLYASDYEHNAIHARDAQGRWTTVVHDPRILWPDTLSMGPDGYLYFTANQLHRQAGFNGGVDRRQTPYMVYRTRVDAKPAPTR
jgi:sugar lactone lactonase YvrE